MPSDYPHRAIPLDSGPPDVCGTCDAPIVTSPYDGAPIHDSPYARAIAYAIREGTADGYGAAGWYLQDTIGGRVTRGNADNARAILAGIDDGDPGILDGLPSADLSGEWADTLTGPALYHDALLAADAAIDADALEYDAWYGDVCDAYEVAFSDAATDAIATACRDALS